MNHAPSKYSQKETEKLPRRKGRLRNAYHCQRIYAVVKLTNAQSQNECFGYLLVSFMHSKLICQEVFETNEKRESFVACSLFTKFGL